MTKDEYKDILGRHECGFIRWYVLKKDNLDIPLGTLVDHVILEFPHLKDKDADVLFYMVDVIYEQIKK